MKTAKVLVASERNVRSMMYTGMASTEAASWFARKSGLNWYSEMRKAVV